MKLIYHKHQSSDSFSDHSWWDEDWYLCDTEEEYQKLRERYEKEAKEKKVDYTKRGYERYAPEFDDERKLKATEYYYGHEWRGENFNAIGFSYTQYHERGSYKYFYLKPGSVENVTQADNSHCAGRLRII